MLMKPRIGPSIPCLAPLALLSFLALTACDSAEPREVEATRETLPDGRMVVTYPALPAAHEDSARLELRIGSVDGGGADVFGEVRGVEVAEDGTIYVLDHQSSEVRAFAPGGRHLRTLTRAGRGPGELSSPNGLALAPDGTLWVSDPGNRALIGLSPEGREIARHPPIVPGWGYIWSGRIDSDGVFWEEWGHPVDYSRPGLTYTGPVEATVRQYWKSFDPRTSTYDSVASAIGRRAGFAAAYPGGQLSTALPFAPAPVGAADAGGRIWTGMSDEYRISRLDASGDTLLVLHVNVAAEPVTSADVEAWQERMKDVFERAPAARQLERLIPETKPLLTRLLTDDEGRLWVGRTVPPGERPLFDVFDAEGEYLGSVHLLEGTSESVRPVIRRGRVYALVIDGELEVPYVTVSAVPPLGSRN